jgi:anaerobic magnesium-protoporphyrin IX monomethyl ester cyclase
MTVLLTTLNAKFIHLNLAIRLLYGLYRKHEGLSWREFTIKEKAEDIAQAIAHYDVVAFSCYIWNITQTLEVARWIKKINPHCKVLLGGPEVSYDVHEFMQYPQVDYIISGEGELPFGAFMANYPHLDGIPNIAFKTEGEINYLSKTTNFDLSQYAGINPYEWDDPTELDKKVGYIETSRGCPYKCEFCLASLDNKVRFLPNDDLKANLLYLMQNGRIIKFLDRTFNIKRDFTIDMFQFILKHRRPENVFQFEITADIVHPDIVQFIQEHVPSGVFRFEIGIQTVNQKANLEVSRKQNFEKTSAIVLQLRDKIEMHLDLIVGLALDRWEDIRYSIEQVFALHPPELQLGFLKFLRGTPLRDKHAQHGFEFDANPPYQIIRSNYLSAEELTRISMLEEALEIYWNKKRALHTLQYVGYTYSIFDFLLGLGEYFHQRCHFHKHTINDIYDLLLGFVKESYPNDPLLIEFVALDYCLRSKIKPQVRYGRELNKQLRHQYITQHKLDHHRRRHIFMEMPFDFKHWENTKSIQLNPHVVVFEYDANNNPKVYSFQPLS